MRGTWKSGSKSAPKPSRIVSPRTRKPQKVTKCAVPDTDHFSSLRWPRTSTTSFWSRTPTSSVRPTAGWPEAMTW